MTRKEQFLTFVFFGALAEDLRNDTTHAQLIAQLACEIPEEKIPHCPANAAKVFLAYCSGRTDKPFKWMLEKAESTKLLEPKSFGNKSENKCEKAAGPLRDDLS